MKYGLDCVSPPAPSQAQEMRELGWEFLGVYVGGPRATSGSTWQQRDGVRHPVRDIRDAGLDLFLPIYVGRNTPWDAPGSLNFEQGLLDGDDANRCTGTCGFDGQSPLALDVEAQTYYANRAGCEAYISGWVQQVNAAGHPAGVYSSMECLSVLDASEIDFKWGAAWSREKFYGRPPVDRFDPATPPPWELWQFAGGSIAGVDVDTNSAVDGFTFARYAL